MKRLEATMITIDEQQILLRADATDKQEAIRQAGQLLVTSGCIEAGLPFNNLRQNWRDIVAKSPTEQVRLGE